MVLFEMHGKKGHAASYFKGSPAEIVHTGEWGTATTKNALPKNERKLNS